MQIAKRNSDMAYGDPFVKTATVMGEGVRSGRLSLTLSYKTMWARNCESYSLERKKENDGKLFIYLFWEDEGRKLKLSNGAE